MAILQGARITGSIIATSFIKAAGFSGSLTASNLYVLGKAGIGTSSPIAPLDVQCNTGATGIILRGRADNSTALRFYANNGTTQQLYIGTDDSNIDFNSVSTRPIRFFVNDLLQYQISQLGVFSWKDGAGGTRMTLNSTGLGIGTSSPGAKLDVNGDVYISPNTAGKNTFILSTNASNDARLLMKSDTTTKVDIQANGASYFNGGNVIIGNTTAYAGLTISDITANDANDSLAFFYRGTAGNHESLIRFYDFRGQLNASFGNNLQDDAIGTQKADLVFKTAFNANPTERMRITNTGNVGIGTTSPVNKLHVSGSSTNLPLKLEGLTSNATGYFLTVDNTTGVVYKSTSGASGTSGTSGANGSPGTSGSSGTSGANGSPGTSGSSGSGSSGISGSSGTSGTTNIKAWVHFDGTGTPTINASLNVSSITDNNTGDYTINFTTAFANANYVVAGTVTYEYENPGQSINNMFIAVPRRPTAQLAGSCRISTPGSDNVLYDCKYVRVLFSN